MSGLEWALYRIRSIRHIANVVSFHNCNITGNRILAYLSSLGPLLAPHEAMNVCLQPSVENHATLHLGYVVYSIFTQLCGSEATQGTSNL